MSQATLIAPNLYLGGMPKNIDAFTHVISVGERPTYLVPVGKLVIVNPILDSYREPNAPRIRQLAEFVNLFKEQGPTLVHCSQGFNRSALVVALSLMISGWSAQAAIELLREKHHREVLKNETFVEFLHAHAA
jgi:protein-tyrosine phosphatase